MLTTYPHPSLRQVEWVSQLVHELRAGQRWIITPDDLACLDPVGLRWFVARGHWPAKFGQPASLWLAEPGDLAVSTDGRHWRRLTPLRGALDPTAVEEAGPVIEAQVPLPTTQDSPDRWIALLAPTLTVVAAEISVPPADDPHAIPASG